MFDGLYNFLFFENLSSIVTIIVGFFVFIIYYIQQKDKIKTGTSIILSEIRQAEDALADFKSNQDLYKTQLDTMSIDSWRKYQHYIEKYLHDDEKKELILFFNKLMALRLAVSQWKENHNISLNTKTKYMQTKLIDLAEECKGDRVQYLKSRDQITSIVHSESYWFEPSVYKKTIDDLVGETPTITTKTTGAKLRKIQSGNFWKI